MLEAATVVERLSRADGLVRAKKNAHALVLLASLGDVVAATPETARLWAEALRRTARDFADAAVTGGTEAVPQRTLAQALDPARAGAVARAALARQGSDPEVVAAVLAAVAALVERRPMDEPVDAESTALLRDAQAAGQACLDGLHAGVRRTADVAVPLLAGLAAVAALRGTEGDDAALGALEEALRIAPHDGALWFDLGLLHKRRGRWAESLDATRRARARLGNTKPVLWNLAIAATALGRGDDAAEAWRALGLSASVARGGMPEVAGLDDVEVRVPTLGDGHVTTANLPDRALVFEVVPVARLSPCHGVVRGPTFRIAQVDVGDVVLFDGAPVRVRRGDDGEPVPCFPLLARLRQGDEARLPFLALEQRAGDVASVASVLPGGVALFVQRTEVEHVCPRCAAGELLVRHQHAPAEEHRLVRGKFVVSASTPLSALRDALDALPRTHPGVLLVCPALLERLGDVVAAAKAHKAWGGLERTHAGKR